jgi:peptidoglycan/LPS O-acetylase OafA/YrhL
MNRGNNLMMVAFLSILAVGVIAELFVETELLDKADDAFVLMLGILAVIWYVRGRNRYLYSWTPFILLALAFAGKALAFANEFNDPAAVGDEFGIVPVLAAMLIISAVILVRTRRSDTALDQGSPSKAPIPSTGEPVKKN